MEREDEALAPDALEVVAGARDVFDQLVFPDDFAEVRTLPVDHQLD